MRRGVVVLGFGLAVGCGFHKDPLPDGGVDIDSCVTFATQFGLDTCQLDFASELMVTGMATYDTDTPALLVAGAPMTVASKPLMLAGEPVDIVSAHNVHLGPSSSLV